MNKRLMIVVLCCVGFWWVPRPSFGQDPDRAQRLREQALDRKLRDSTGLAGEFNNFSKESDDELLKQLDTLKKSRDEYGYYNKELTPDAGPGAADSWEQHRKD